MLKEKGRCRKQDKQDKQERRKKKKSGGELRKSIKNGAAEKERNRTARVVS